MLGRTGCYYPQGSGRGRGLPRSPGFEWPEVGPHLDLSAHQVTGSIDLSFFLGRPLWSWSPPHFSPHTRLLPTGSSQPSSFPASFTRLLTPPRVYDSFIHLCGCSLGHPVVTQALKSGPPAWTPTGPHSEPVSSSVDAGRALITDVSDGVQFGWVPNIFSITAVTHLVLCTHWLKLLSFFSRLF